MKKKKVCMNTKRCTGKPGAFLLVIIFVSISFWGQSQTPRKTFYPDSLTNAYYWQLKKEFGNKKQYPPQFEKQILIALSYYPELKNTPILFRIRARHTGLNTRATWPGIFESTRKRHFVITISDSSENILMPLMFKSLPFNAQVGVMGHELAHVTDFLSMTTQQIIMHAIKNISAKYIDRFEYNTDAICIAHGLGYQLLAYSSYVRQKMNREYWRGCDFANHPMDIERYMNPATILERINSDPIYKDAQ
jgi:hypothetical protein